MGSRSFYISDVEVFEASKREVEKSILIDAKLPKQVFQQGFKYFAFEDFDWTLSSDFWPVITKMAVKSNDASVLMAVLDPDPVNYYKKEFGYYNWAEIPLSISSDDYLDVINEHPLRSLADSARYNSERIVWLPRSAQWSICGHRSYGVCVLGSQDQVTLDSTWCDCDLALENLLPQCFRGNVIPPSFASELRSNFSKRADPPV